jgi:hypothetical protein
MRKGEAPAGLDLKELVLAVQDRTMTCTELERLDVAVKYGELLKGIGDDLVGHFVEEARKSGASWAQIGERLGVTKQAAHQRHVRREPRLFGRRRATASDRGLFERFTQEGRDVIVAAQKEARGLRHNYIGVEHLLLALTGSSLGAVLRDGGVTSDAVLGEVRRIVGEGTEPLREPIPFTPRSKAALQVAARTAERSGQMVQPGHILLGVLDLRSGVGAEILDHLKAPRDELRPRTLEALGD